MLHIGQQNSGRLLASQNPPSVKQAVNVGGNQDTVPLCCPEDQAPDQVTVLFRLRHSSFGCFFIKPTNYFNLLSVCQNCSFNIGGGE